MTLLNMKVSTGHAFVVHFSPPASVTAKEFEMHSTAQKADRVHRFILFFFLLGIGGLTACTDGPTNPEPSPSTAAVSTYGSPLPTGPHASHGPTDAEFGCIGTIWLPRKGEYRAIAIPVHLPDRIMGAAEGATRDFRFVIYEDAPPAGRALLDVKCTLPDVDDPRIEKAHELVANFLSTKFDTLQKAAEAEARKLTGLNDMSRSASGGITARLSGEPPSAETQTCGWTLIDTYLDEEGRLVYVYTKQCSDGGGDDDGTGGGSGGDDRPSYCDTQLTPTPECEGGGGGGGSDDAPTASGNDAFYAQTALPDCDSPLNDRERAFCEGFDPVGNQFTIIETALDNIGARGGVCSKLADAGRGLLSARTLHLFDYETFVFDDPNDASVVPRL